jgi:Tfp pilus assembly protein PilN
MTNHVSLLPPEIKRRRQERENRKKIQMLILLFLILLAVINVFFFVNTLLVRDNLKSLQLERETVEQQAAALEEFAELDIEINTSQQLVGSAMGTVPRWSAFFRSISQAKPVTAWFSDLTAVYSDETGTLTIRGWSYDHDTLADLLERMNTMEQLDQVNCRVSTETNYQGKEVIQFQIDAALLSGPGFFVEQDGETEPLDAQNQEAEQVEEEEGAQ